MIDFSLITACGECCVGCKKKEEGMCPKCMKADGLFMNGHNLGDVRFIHV